MAESSVPLLLPASQPTPKRKRDDLITEQRALRAVPTPSLLTRTMFSFEAPQLSSEREDGSNSPRSRVAHQFRDLVLADGGGGVAAAAVPALQLPNAGSSTRNDSDSGGTSHGNDIRQPKFPPVIFDFESASSSDRGRSGTRSCAHPQQPMDVDDDQDPVLRKRVKLPDMEPEACDPATRGGASDKAGPVHVDTNGRLSLDAGIDPYILKTVKAAEVGSLQKSYPSINRLGVAKSRAHRSASTPPLGASRRSKTVVEAVEGEEVIVVDPVRAELTWHEDEITVYDSDDKDDDGTGLNGIGFKPTAAVAHARAQKRRQQLQEYKKREESDARARRNQRRREQLGEKPAPARRTHSLLRVHFSDPESDAVVTT